MTQFLYVEGPVFSPISAILPLTSLLCMSLVLDGNNTLRDYYNGVQKNPQGNCGMVLYYERIIDTKSSENRRKRA